MAASIAFACCFEGLVLATTRAAQSKQLALKPPQ
jgi:hypothetical protein